MYRRKEWQSRTDPEGKKKRQMEKSEGKLEDVDDDGEWMLRQRELLHFSYTLYV